MVNTVPASPPPSNVLPYRTLREFVQTRLADDLRSADVRPGQRLVEAELAERYGVSRGPVREAIRALEGQGLVRFTSNKGAVASILSTTQVREIYDMRIELEGLAARRAAPLVTDPWLAALSLSLAQMDEVLDAADVWLRLNDAFHGTVYALTGLDRLCGLIADLMATIQPYARLYLDLPGRLADTHADHHLLVQALADRDPARAEAITQEHLRRSADIIVKAVEHARF